MFARWIKIWMLILLFVPLGVRAQSIYSRVGVGDITLPQSSRAQGLGMYGIATADYNQISLINPANWYLPRLTAITMKVNSSRYTNSLGGMTDQFGFDGFNFHFPVGQSIGFGLGFAPYSTVRYDFARTDSVPIAGTGTGENIRYNLHQQGRGGVGGNFIGLGVRVSDHVSLGAAFSFLIGEISTRRTLEVTSASYLSRRVLSSTHIYGDNMVLGLYLSNIFREQEHLGFRTEIPLSLLVRREDDYYTGNPVQTEFTNLLWPWEFGVGYETQIRNRWIAVAEGNMWMSEKDLSILSLHQTGYTQKNGLEIGVGVERRPDFSVPGWGDHLSWRLGMNWRQYLTADPAGNHTTGMKWVGGVGVPFGRGPLGPGTDRLDISLFYLRRAPADASDPVESAIGLQLGFTVSEVWF